jgi:hypothetical protein
MKFIKDCTLDEIGESLTRICMLADIEPPQYPKMVAEFLQKQFYRFEISVLYESFDLWIAGKIDIRRCATLNAQFVSSVVNRCIKDGLLKQVTIWRPPVKNNFVIKEVTDEDRHRSYNTMMNDWSKYELSNGVFNIPLMFVQIQYEFIFRNIDKMNYSNAARFDMITELQKSYIEARRLSKLKENNGRISNFILQLDDKLPNVNWNRIACVGLHFRDVCKKKLENIS